jgi:hypothetical protein
MNENGSHLQRSCNIAATRFARGPQNPTIAGFTRAGHPRI